MNEFASFCFNFSDGHDAAKGLAAFDLDGTFVKVVIAFDVDGNRQEASVLKYNVEVNTPSYNSQRLSEIKMLLRHVYTV